MNTPNALGVAPIRPLFFKYYLPTMVSLLSMTLHQVINGIILGQRVGKEGIAAVGLYGPVLIVFIALTLPVMISGGILISKNIGAKQYDEVQKVFNYATSLGLLFGGIIALSTPFMLGWLSRSLAGSESATMVANVADYAFWQLITLPFFFIRMFWGNFLSNDGAPKAGRNGNLVAVALNILLDLYLIIGLGMGVKGASIATAISIVAGTLYLFIFIQRRDGHFSFNKFRFTLRFANWRELFRSGLPTFASELSFSTGLLLINHSVVSYGPLAVAAFGLVNYVSFIFIRIFTAAMIASFPIISYNIGAKLPGRVLGIFRFAMLFTIIAGVIVWAIGFLIPGLLITVFSGNETEEFRQLASSATSLYFILFLAAGPNLILGAYLQSIGKTTLATAINLLKGLVLIALFLMVLPGYFDLGLNSVWLSRSLAEVFTIILIGGYTLIKKQNYYSDAAILAGKKA